MLGEVEFDPIQLESAISSTIFEIVEDEGSVFDAAKQVSYLTIQTVVLRSTCCDESVLKQTCVSTVTAV